VCLCYNHEAFVKDAIQSILDQTYENIEIIVYDDKSTDNSHIIISDFIVDHPKIKFFRSETNLGNCKAFNCALNHANGTFIIDLAADDMLTPDRVTVGVKSFNKLGKEYGVHYSNAHITDETSLSITKERKHPLARSGDLYEELIQHYFINPASMMFRSEMLKSLGGYDEKLSYEDFDIWIRTSRDYLYTYSDESLVTKRIVKSSLSHKQFKVWTKHQSSTLAVCRKILKLNKIASEDRALRKRVIYEIGLCIRYLNWHLIPAFLSIYVRSYKNQALYIKENHSRMEV
jgi:glycosyltransferase involved in cell wall biosynthesis